MFKASCGGVRFFDTIQFLWWIFILCLSGEYIQVPPDVSAFTSTGDVSLSAKLWDPSWSRGLSWRFAWFVWWRAASSSKDEYFSKCAILQVYTMKRMQFLFLYYSQYIIQWQNIKIFTCFINFDMALWFTANQQSFTVLAIEWHLLWSRSTIICFLGTRMYDNSLICTFFCS